MHWVDYLIVAASVLMVIGVGIYFSKRAGSDIDSFFLSSRSLNWYIAGTSIIATSFACDTPLWITSLIRQHGINAVWQFWAPVVGSGLAVVLFGRLWRRVGLITDLELIELRYSGRPAAWLRGCLAGLYAILIAPLIVGWVVKAMEVISTTAIGVPEEYRWITTFVLVGASVLICALSGLYGVVYSDFIQFIVASIGMLLLAIIAVQKVGGLQVLVDTLSLHSEWPGRTLTVTPEVGTLSGGMSIWNAIGYFGLLWIIVAQSGGYQAQRLLATRDVREASLAQLLYTIVYYCVMAWPWIIIALCSIVLLPAASGVSHDSAFPRMVTDFLPIGLRGVVVAALVAAFASTISTIFNWASSYLVVDLYKRFVQPAASDRHYVLVARLATVAIAIAGGLISLTADSIQELLELYYVVALPINILAVMRWFWWRQNAAGELAGIVAAWSLAVLLLFAKVFDAPFRSLFGLSTAVDFSTDYSLLGARLLFVAIPAITIAVATSLMTPATDMRRMKDFVLRVRPFQFGWKPVIATLQKPYVAGESPFVVAWQWLAVLVSAFSLLFGIGQFLLGSVTVGAILLAVFAFSLVWTVRNINRSSVDATIDAVPDVEPISICTAE